MASQNEHDRTYMPVFLLGVFLVVLNIYWFAYDFFFELGARSDITDQILVGLQRARMFDSQYTLKIFILIFLFFTYAVKGGKTVETPWPQLLYFLAFSLAVFFFPKVNSPIYILTTAVGFVLVSMAIADIGKRINAMRNPNKSPYETFEQGTKKPVITDYSVNFRIQYMVNGRWRKGWLNVVNPFRGNMIFGLPGSGKSYSIILEYIWQTISKGFSEFVYDFKYPELATFTYNCYLRSKDVFVEKYGVEPYFCVVNMSNPSQSMRCNPLNKRYINSMSDAIQKAKIIRKNRMDPNKDVGFFADNAENLWAACIWALRQIDGGKYCTLPHFIELVLSPQEKLYALLSKKDFGLEPLIRDIIAADAKGANDQAQGIYASATTPLKTLRTERFYWVFGANSVDLAINKRAKPTIFCVGNDPGSKDVYATGIALITSEMYLQVNAPGRVPCALVQDEYPTMKPEGFDTIVATGRSNLLSAVAAAQDMDQLIRDLKKEDANAFLSIIGNQFFGQMTGSHKREISEMFGQHYVRQQSTTTGGYSDTVNTSYHLEKRLPEDKIATLSQGTFAAIVTDGRGEEKLDSKLFCAEILIDPNGRPNKKDGKWKEIPNFAEDIFNRKQVKKQVEDSPEIYCVEIITRRKKEKQEQEKEANPFAVVFNDVYLQQEAKKEWEQMKADEKNALLEEAVKVFQEEEETRRLRAKMVEVTQDIDVIFEKYDILDSSEAAGKKPQIGQPLNGGEKPQTFKPDELDDEDDVSFKGKP